MQADWRGPCVRASNGWLALPLRAWGPERCSPVAGSRAGGSAFAAWRTGGLLLLRQALGQAQAFA